MGLRTVLVALLLFSTPAAADSLITGEINDKTVVGTLLDLSRLLPGAATTITLDSVGGELDAGRRVQAAIRAAQRRKSVVTCVVSGQALSMAAYILETCSVRWMRAGATLMFHEPAMSARGNRWDLLKAADEIAADTYRLMIPAAARMKISQDVFEANIRDHDWVLNATEALEVGAIDRIVP